MIQIRQVQPEDMFAVMKLAHDTLPERYHTTLFNTFYETTPQGFLVATRYHSIVGFLIGIKIDLSHAKIVMLGVKPDHRRQGIGAQLVSHFVHICIEDQVATIDLEVNTSNTSAQQFYQKQGFVITDTLSQFYENGDDALSMTKDLLAN